MSGSWEDIPENVILGLDLGGSVKLRQARRVERSIPVFFLAVYSFEICVKLLRVSSFSYCTIF